jgi:predicted transcriptional regulator
MAPLSSLPKSELEIARIVCDLGQATVRQVADALPPDRNIDFWTVQTYLRRLADKGFLRVKRQGRANVYFPRVESKRILVKAVSDFLERALGGETLPLMQHLIHKGDLTDAEIGQLQQALDALKERKK